MEAESDRSPVHGRAPAVTRRGRAGVEDRGSDIFFAAIETTPMPAVLSDPNQPDNPIVFANRAFLEMTGYGRGEVVGRNCRFLQGTETEASAVDAVRRAVRARGEVAVELLNYRKDGTAFWNALFVSPVFDTEGRLVYFFASQLDVSRRRAAEEALREAERLAAVGRLAGGIAHDFNNLLQVISGYADRLKGQLAASADPKMLRQIGAVAEAADRAAALARDLLAASRGSPPAASMRDADAVAGPVPGRAAGRGAERVLVVDDRAEVAELARTMLGDAGYAVAVARDGREALARLEEGFDLLFSDLVMPGGLDGLGLAREARRRHPALKVLLTTGHVDPSTGQGEGGAGEFDAIAKPYRRAELARTVRRVLDAPAVG